MAYDLSGKISGWLSAPRHIHCTKPVHRHARSSQKAKYKTKKWESQKHRRVQIVRPVCISTPYIRKITKGIDHYWVLQNTNKKPWSTLTTKKHWQLATHATEPWSVSWISFVPYMTLLRVLRKTSTVRHTRSLKGSYPFASPKQFLTKDERKCHVWRKNVLPKSNLPFFSKDLLEFEALTVSGEMFVA